MNEPCTGEGGQQEAGLPQSGLTLVPPPTTRWLCDLGRMPSHLYTSVLIQTLK